MKQSGERSNGSTARAENNTKNLNKYVSGAIESELEKLRSTTSDQNIALNAAAYNCSTDEQSGVHGDRRLPSHWPCAGERVDGILLHRVSELTEQTARPIFTRSLH